MFSMVFADDFDAVFFNGIVVGARNHGEPYALVTIKYKGVK